MMPFSVQAEEVLARLSFLKFDYISAWLYMSSVVRDAKAVLWFQIDTG